MAEEGDMHLQAHAPAVMTPDAEKPDTPRGMRGDNPERPQAEPADCGILDGVLRRAHVPLQHRGGQLHIHRDIRVVQFRPPLLGARHTQLLCGGNIRKRQAE